MPTRKKIIKNLERDDSFCDISFVTVSPRYTNKNHNFCSSDILLWCIWYSFFFIARHRQAWREKEKLDFQAIEPLRSECRGDMFPFFSSSVAYSTFCLPRFHPPLLSFRSQGLNFKRKANSHPEKMIRKKSFILVKIKTVKVKILLWISAFGTDELFQQPIRAITFFFF